MNKTNTFLYGFNKNKTQIQFDFIYRSYVFYKFSMHQSQSPDEEYLT